MSETITVKGIGKATEKPDYVVLSMILESSSLEYEKAIEDASEKLDQLNGALMSAGFEKDSLKTADFNVHTDYESIREANGSYKSVFKGYTVCHSLKLSFDFNMQTLSETLSAVAGCLSHPQLSIAFTAKDAAAINEKLLCSAAKNARRKAEILCSASGVVLGKLINIDYNWNDVNIRSDTRYNCADGAVNLRMVKAMDIVPEDITASDSASFTWEILNG